MEIVEKFSVAKAVGRVNEDMIFVNDNYIAVIDGAGDPLRRTHDGKSFGRLAAEALTEKLSVLPGGVSAREVVDVLSGALKDLTNVLATEGFGAPAPAANVVIYSILNREIIRVGDASILVDGVSFSPPRKEFERVVADVRQLIMHSGMSAGLSLEELNKDVLDAFSVIYKYQEKCQNTKVKHKFSFPVFDGSTMPDWAFNVTSVSPDAKEIVLASDGYPELFVTLQESEDFLTNVLKTDPLMIDTYVQTKGPANPGESFDDRSYIRFKLK